MMPHACGMAGVGDARLRLAQGGPGPAWRVPSDRSVASALSISEGASRSDRAWPDSAWSRDLVTGLPARPTGHAPPSFPQDDVRMAMAKKPKKRRITGGGRYPQGHPPRRGRTNERASARRCGVLSEPAFWASAAVDRDPRVGAAAGCRKPPVGTSPHPWGTARARLQGGSQHYVTVGRVSTVVTAHRLADDVPGAVGHGGERPDEHVLRRRLHAGVRVGRRGRLRRLDRG